MGSLVVVEVQVSPSSFLALTRAPAKALRRTSSYFTVRHNAASTRPSCASTRRRGFPGTGGPVPASTTTLPPKVPCAGIRGWNASPQAVRTAELSATSGVPGPPSPAAGPDSWTGPLRQEIPLHFQLSDLLVQPGDQSRVTLGPLFLTIAEDTGRSLQQGLLPGLDLTRVNLIPGGQLGHRLLSLHRRQGHLGFKTPGYASSVAPCPTPSQQLPLPLV